VTKDKEIYHSLNLLKAIAIFFVVFYHNFFAATDLLSSASVWNYLHYFIKTILSICVPIFFFVNGALLFHKKLDIKRHIKKILRIMILTLAWAIITCLLLMLIKQETLSIKDILKKIWTWEIGWTNHLWFLAAIAVIYIFFPLMKSAYDNNKKSFYFFFFAICIFTFGNVFLSMCANVFQSIIKKQYFQGNFNFFNHFNAVRGIYGYALGYFMLGGICFANKEKVTAKRFKLVSLIIPFSMLLLMAYGIMMSRTEDKMFDVVWNGYDSIFTAINVLAVFILSLSYKGGGRIGKAIAAIGNNSLGIYLVHIPLGAFFSPFYKQFFLSQNLIVNALYASVLLLLSLGICLGLKRVPIVKQLFSI